jgi:hypothetical protein
MCNPHLVNKIIMLSMGVVCTEPYVYFLFYYTSTETCGALVSLSARENPIYFA